MQEFSLANQKLGQWIRMEHYRLHSAETLPDGPYKEAVLAAIHSGLKRLKEASSAPFEPPVCTICAVQEGQISGAGVSGIKTPHHHHAVGGISWRQSRARCCTSAPACCSAARSRWRSRKRTQAFQRSTASSLSGAIRAVNLSEPSTRETRENEGTAGSHATSAGALSSLSRPREC